MIHYHVWFNLKETVSEASGLAMITRFLKKVCSEDDAASFQLLSNKGRPPRSKLARYHALIQFADDAHLGRAMKKQTELGLHSGGHGEVMDVVTDFHVEIFSLLNDMLADPALTPYACEI
jgi:hypothetical protein